MNIRSIVSSLNIGKREELLMTRYLEKVVSGSEDVYMTPVAERLGPKNILEGWDLIYKSNSRNINSKLQEIEESNRSKFGPRSVALPWDERKELVADYFNDEKSTKVPKAQPTNRRLRPLSLQTASKYLKNSTNSGLPFLVKKVNAKLELLNNFNSYLERQDPCVLFTRTQESKKTRTVWGFPLADTLNEMMYYQPLLSHQRSLFWRTAVTTPDNVSAGITDLILYAMKYDLYLLSIDFKSYDATVKAILQNAAFNYIKGNFQKSEESRLDYIRDRFLNIGLVTPDGVWYGPHGVPSGSTFTNEVDSIAQYLIARDYNEPLDKFQIQGDDGAYACRNTDELIRHFESYGLIVSKDKSYVSKEYVVYLQNLFHVDYIKDGKIPGIYPIYRALLRLCYQERFEDFSKDDITGKDYYSIRAISILENCKHHPLFEQFVEYIFSLDKYGLLPSDQGISQFIKMRSKQDGKDINFNSHSYGDEVKGIREFKTFKILQRLNV